jgi:two-component system nitrate/nitrite response regulator NarL
LISFKPVELTVISAGGIAATRAATTLLNLEGTTTDGSFGMEIPRREWGIGVARKNSLSESAGGASLGEFGPAITALVADVTRMGCQLMASAFMQSAYPIEVTALAVDSREVRRTIKQTQPDVAVIGAGLKDGPNMGLQTARELWVSGSKTKVIILIDASEGATVVEAFRAGAHGVICRDDPFETLCKCVHVVRQGQVWINSSQLRHLIDYLVRSAPLPMTNLGGSKLLTKREEGVVHLVAEGLTNREISRQLSLSEHTVRNYLFRIFNKLGTSTRLELAVYVNNCRKGRQGEELDSECLSPQ